jgi:TonB family protein
MTRSILVFLALLSIAASAQENSITGRLIDSESKAPIANATVKKSGTSTVTNHLGYFQLNAAAGDTLVVSHQEYGELVLVTPAQTRFALALEKPKPAEVKIAPATGTEKLLRGSSAVYKASEVERTPVPVMGLEKFREEWAKSVEYPSDARKEKTQGTVEIYFVVNATGKIIDSGIEKGIGNGCENAALKAFRRMKAEWKPGLFNGQAVSVRMTMPYEFKLN